MGKTVPFDAADQKQMKALQTQVLDPLKKTGVDFWWVDWQQYPDTRGVPELTNLWWLNRLFFRYTQEDGRRGVSLSRYAGWGRSAPSRSIFRATPGATGVRWRFRCRSHFDFGQRRSVFLVARHRRQYRRPRPRILRALEPVRRAVGGAALAFLARTQQRPAPVEISEMGAGFDAD